MDKQILDLDSLAWFAQVVQSGGFSPAARALGVPRQAVHRRITGLEKSLGLRLLERSTRQVRPTDVGLRLYQHAYRVLAEARAATAAMAQSRAQPTGTLRLTAPPLFAEYFLPAVIARFLARWPQVRIEAALSVHREDLLGAGLDLAIRIGPMPDSSLLARRLGTGRLVSVAAPAYLASHPAPEHPDDLRDHITLHYGQDREPARWTFERPPERIELEIQPALHATSAPLVLDVARRGQGIARLPSFMCHDSLESGELIEVLRDWSAPGGEVHALYPSHTAGNPSLRAFLDMLAHHLASEPWLQG